VAGNADLLNLFPRMIGQLLVSAIKKVAELEAIYGAAFPGFHKIDILYSERSAIDQELRILRDL
jgi:hypothetical protein